ncbi:MAG TPA: methylmalonyl-CoA mutase family protein, partial [Actinomycetota bacterium]|nr:methylmalonyl-CoA mutase family protein [Actinomycetota bacterium]
EKGRLIKVGVNEFVDEDETPLDTLKIPHAVEVEQIEGVQRLRGERDDANARNALERLKAAAADESVNMMPALIDCARAYCTEGEIVTALKEIFGEYTETPRF